MATFTFPVTMTFTASIDADHEGEARLTIQRDLNEVVADKDGAEFTTDNGAKVELVAAQVDGEVSMRLDTMARMIAVLRELAYGNTTGGRMNEIMGESRAILAQIDGLSSAVEAPRNSREIAAEFTPEAQEA